MDTNVKALEAAKALRVICPHARQLGMLIRYLEEYLAGNPTPFVEKFAHNQMLDMLATDYGIRLAAVIRSQIGFFLQEQGGRHLTMDDIPDGLGIAPIEGDVSLQEMVDLLTKTKQEFMTLKDRVLYVALQRGDLTSGGIGMDDGVCWLRVTWQKRGFLMPASAEQAAWCRDIGGPEMSKILTGTVPIQIRHRQDAIKAQEKLETFLTQNRSSLDGFDSWMQSRDSAFMQSKRSLN